MLLFRLCTRPPLVVLALLLGACGGGEAPAPSASAISVPAPALTPETTPETPPEPPPVSVPDPEPLPVPVPDPVPEPPPVPTTYSVAPADGAALLTDTPVVVRFSAAMNPASLVLDSDLARQATAAWSATAHTNDTLTLHPPAGGWLGQGPLRLRANDALGRALTAEAAYDVVIGLETFQAASTVIGQPDFSSADANAGALVSAQTLSDPSGKVAIGPQGELFVADTRNHRVLRYPATVTAAGAAADRVLGQTGFDQAIPQTTQAGLRRPSNVAILGKRLAVADALNRRVLLWNTLPTTNGAPADVVIGQADFVSNAQGCDARSFAANIRVAFSPDGKLLVADESNHRVLVWNQVPTANGTPADLVIGQSTFERCAIQDDNQDGFPDSGPTARTLALPGELWTDGQRLVVSDTANHRVLIWNHFPTAPFQGADLVLGQSGFAQRAPNDDNQDGTSDATPSPRTFYVPRSVHANGVQLAVADYENNRVLIWDRFPTTSFQPADRVLGQGRFTLAAYNDSDQDGVDDGQPSALTTSGPAGVLLHGNRLFVTLDGHGGNRVLVFESP